MSCTKQKSLKIVVAEPVGPQVILYQDAPLYFCDSIPDDITQTGKEAPFVRNSGLAVIPATTRPLSHLKEVETKNRKKGETLHYVANRTLSLLHIVFNKAIEWGYCKGSNPAHKISRFKEKSRERFLQADELPRFFDTVANEENENIRDYILISLLTGARKSNVLAMRWEHVNLASRIWFISETKNGSSQTVPLTEEAVKILEQRKAQADGEWVFPGPGKTGHLVEVKRAWARILERADIKELRIHDLRRTLGSWQAATGANLSVIGRTLNHSNVSTTAIYARLSLDPIRQAMEVATSAMLKTTEDHPKNLLENSVREHETTV